MTQKLIDPVAVETAIVRLTTQRDAAIEQAVDAGHDLFCVARILQDIPVELEIETQVQEIVQGIDIQGDDERAAVTAMVRNRFAQLERKAANV